MLTIDQNKRIPVELGLCEKCRMHPCQNRSADCPYPLYFNSWMGFRLIVENGPKQDWWGSFKNHLNGYIGNYEGEELDHLPMKCIGPALAVELSGWLEGREK